MNLGQFLSEFLSSTGIVRLFTGNGWMNLIMIAIGCIFLYLAIKKGFEPYLLVPISFGIILVNLFPEIYITYNEAGEVIERGLLGWLHVGVECEIYPCLIFLGIGATTDFGPLIANKKTMLLGAAAQIGIFIAFFGALLLGFNFFEAASIGIIGGADGPTAILTSNRLLSLSHSEQYLAPIALAAYSYMALVPIIFPPVIRLFTTKKERQIKMEQLREVSKQEKILFPIVVTLIVSLIVPSATPLIGCLMLGNLVKECGVVPNLTNTMGNSLLYICTILLGLSVGATAKGTEFLTVQTLSIFALGITAFIVAAAFGLLGGKLMCALTGGKVNPMIGAAGVSAVPMAARVVQKEGQKEDPSNFLLMHAMGPNVAGVIGSAIAAGILLTIFG
ncbi:MAG: sodium ion-translocating decarboxylase subunit beta [Solobacterium sp.]|nr:sodium ion-translocating decarboxylase subunit beta [Solobacterium sp.]MDY2731278.1 sodium ion-translocating decarboxylase subunit beta [Erysipelotrichaceae bacterium]MCI7732060.1 sodium ion-translocating decarboxylase subunit beta [Solobacterium sp.]MDD6122290.1 sodium ion-translocating decarboxylase subunit beta [Solobacterium sp.]MDD6497982.1 sodium ion-translocating decarboxylase subunit beta [Solobacterium sp.]